MTQRLYEFVTLNGCFGSTISDPDEADLKNALAETFKAQDEEHPDCWLECGSEAGPLQVLTVCFDGSAWLTTFSDVDMSAELAEEEFTDLDVDRALALFKKLINGKIPA